MGVASHPAVSIDVRRNRNPGVARAIRCLDVALTMHLMSVMVVTDRVTKDEAD
jgi:hypothetical protein